MSTIINGIKIKKLRITPKINNEYFKIKIIIYYY